ncbi:hypothetical protein LCGC14_1813220, partial [marine sediment metagenome]
MRKIDKLRRAAIAAHTAGIGWPQFFRENYQAINNAEPYDVRRYRRLGSHLMHLCMTGDPSGEYGIGDDDALEPWTLDDEPEKPADVGAVARFDVARAGLGQAGERPNGIRSPPGVGGSDRYPPSHGGPSLLSRVFR